MEALLEAVLEIIGTVLEERLLSIDDPILRTALNVLGFIMGGITVAVVFFAIYCIICYL